MEKNYNPRIVTVKAEITTQEEFDSIVNTIGLERLFDGCGANCSIFNHFASKYSEEVSELLMKHLSKTYGQRRTRRKTEQLIKSLEECN